MNELASDRLHNLIERLLTLQPAVEKYRELENLLAGTMLTADVDEITIPGKGRVVWAHPGSNRRGFNLVVEPAEKPVGALITVIPIQSKGEQDGTIQTGRVS